MNKHTKRKMSADNYFSIVPEWVLFSEVSTTAKVIYAVLQRYADSDGVCFPSRATMADRIQVSVKTVDRSLEELTAIGAVEISRRFGDDGSYRSNEYKVITANPAPWGKNDPTLGTNMTPPRDTSDHSPRDTSVHLTRTTTNQSQVTRTTLPEIFDQETFEMFWNTYPRKTGKETARKAWIKALKKTTPEQIIQGAKRYASSRIGQDPKYTKHPGPWLNDERWTDEPDPEYTTTNRTEISDRLFTQALERINLDGRELGT